MSPLSTNWAEVDENGRLVVPPELAAEWGLVPGAQLRLEKNGHGMKLHRPVQQLTKVYIEPTDMCNLNCRTCFRNSWNEPAGRMSEHTFTRILDGVKSMFPRPDVYFGGIGEPLYHPKTIGWISRARDAGCHVELITNGTTLTERKRQALIDSGLDRIWISLDGATPESYADVRLGAELPQVLDNIRALRVKRPGGHFPRPEIGIAFVAMKRNIGELPALLRLARELGAKYFSVSNVLPISLDLQEERLYTRSLRSINYLPGAQIPQLSLPKMDFDELTRTALFSAFDSGFSVNFAGNNLGGANDVCNFIEKGTISFAWDGAASPCWPLMHTHTSYLHGKERVSLRHVIGNINDKSLLELWHDPAYVAYRKRLHGFEFAPCTFCGGCEVSVSNEEDCYSNPFPVCGGCLWAQGVVQCP